jgi:uncharacterized protein (TIGR03083 family)
MDSASLTDQDRMELFEQAASSVEEVASGLAADEWDLPTDCPGWTVKDQLSHLVSYEAAAVGRPHAPEDLDVDKYPYVKDPIQAGNEREVEARRSRSGPEVLAEYREVIAERIAQLSGLDQSEKLDKDDTPVGLSDIPWMRFLPVRVADFFFHEQDIRRATNKPGHLNGAVARNVFERMATIALPRFGKWVAGLPEGAVVVFDVEQPGEAFGITTQDGKGKVVDPPADPTVRFRSDFEAFFLLVGGRKSPAELKDAGRLHVEGDESVAARVLEQIAVIP